MDQGRGQRSIKLWLRAIVSVWVIPFILLLAGQTAWAQYGQIAELVNVTGASNFSGNGFNSNPAIYGGVAGSLPAPGTAGCTQDGTSACNTCTSTTACNANRIYPSEQVTITAAIISGVQTGYANFAFLVAETGNGTYQAINASSGQGSPVYAAGQTVSFTTTWQDICTAFADMNGTNTDCNTSANPFNLYLVLQNTTTFSGQLVGDYQLIQVYIMGATDPNPMNPCLTGASSTTDAYGFCNFFANAGDSEVYIENPAENISCPGNSGNTGISGVRVFYLPDDGTNTFSSINYSSPHQDFQIDSNCNPVGNWTVTGLTNGQGYFFLISVLDAANNNSLLLDNTPTSVLLSSNGGPCFDGSNFNQSQINSCLQYSVPGKVIGLLPGGVSCFIATAAYGSPFQPIVKTLRAWRDQFLLPYHYGRAFVRFYYRHSPYFAIRIRKSAVLKHITQAALVPVWSVAWLMLNYGSIGAILIIVSSIFLFVYLTRDART